jgi:queuine tRNA-ribosyltransferase
MNLNNAKYIRDGGPIDATCGCPVCQRYSRGYLRHLLRAGEMLGMRLAVAHNLWFYNHLMADIRAALDAGTFDSFRREKIEILGRRI